MPLTPYEIEDQISEHDLVIMKIYDTLSEIEYKADAVQSQLQLRFDRIESRLQHVDVGAGAARRLLADIDTHLGNLGIQLGRVEKYLNGLDPHLTEFDAHLDSMDTTLIEILRGLPESA
jgi:hypothetical protein